MCLDEQAADAITALGNILKVGEPCIGGEKGNIPIGYEVGAGRGFSYMLACLISATQQRTLINTASSYYPTQLL
jgi:hypothetical protein